MYALVITGAIKGTSQAKLYINFRLETLKLRCWCIFKYLFFRYTIIYAKLETYYLLKMLLKTGRPVPSPYFNIYNPVWLKLLTRLRVELSHLSEHKFNGSSRFYKADLLLYGN